MAIWAAIAIETTLKEVVFDAPDDASQAEVQRLGHQVILMDKARTLQSRTELVVTGRVSEPPKIPPSPMPAEPPND